MFDAADAVLVSDLETTTTSKAKLRERISVLGTDYGALGEWCEPGAIPKELGGDLEWDHASWVSSAP